MELFLIARWLAFELVVVGVSSSPFFVCCVRFGHDVCSVEEEKGTSSHSGNGQHPGDQSNSRRLGWCCTTHSIRFPYSLLFSPLFSFLIWVLHMIYKSHSTLLYHVVYYLELLNGHGRAAGQERKMPSDCHFLFEWLAPLCLSIRVRIKNKGISKREKKKNWKKKNVVIETSFYWTRHAHIWSLYGGSSLTISNERELTVNSISRGMTIDYFIFVFRLLSFDSSHSLSY